MPEVFSDTSPLQYLHQLDLLHILPALAGRIAVPPSVEKELLVGRNLGINLPDLVTLEWLEIRRPTSRPALPLVNDLGPGETETLKISFTGTLGLLLDAKKRGLIPALRPQLDRLQALRFRLASHTWRTILQLAGEEADF